MKNTRTNFLYSLTLVVFLCFSMTGIVNADSLYFNGVDSRVQIPDSLRLSGGPGRSLTVEAWIYPTILPAETGKHIVAKYLNYNNKDWGLLIDKDGLVGFQKETWSLPGCQVGNWLVWSSEAIQGNEWSHIAFVFDNDNDIVKIYINGVPKGSRALTNCDLPDTSAVVWIGGPGPFYYSINQLGIFDGCIDEVRIWDIARTDDEISDNMPIGSITGGEEGLVAFFDFSPGADPTVLYDLSGNSNDGDIYNATFTSVCILPVSVDIKPDSEPNSINCNNANGVITVAILTTAVFDATTVDHTSVTFEGASETHVDKKTGEPRRHEEDVDGDGDTDLVFHFRLSDTSLTCDSEEGTLVGETFYGQLITGTDSVRIIGDEGP